MARKLDRRRSIGAWAATAGMVAVTLGGCSWVKDPNAQPEADPSSSAQPLPTQRPTGAPLAFNNPGATTFEEDGVLKAVTGEDIVVTMTETTVTARSLPSLEPAYQLSASDGRLTDLRVAEEQDAAYLVESTNEAGTGTFIGEDTFTLTRFNLTTGEVTDVATAVLPQDSEGDALAANARIAGFAGEVVVLESTVSERGAVATIAVDVELDDVLWRERPAKVLAVTEDRVVVSTARPDQPGVVAAYDAATGDRLWRSLPGTTSASGVGAAGGTVTVVRSVGASLPASIYPLDLRTGEPGQPVTTDRPGWACHPTSGTVAVCTMADDDDVVGWDLEENRARWSLPAADRFAPLVTLVSDDRVYGMLDSGIGVVLNALTGEDLADNTGASPVAVNDWGGAVLYQGKALFMPAFAEQTGSGAASPSRAPGESESAPIQAPSSSSPTAPATATGR